MAPTAIAICGIHSGVASLPCEMSLKTCDCHARRTLYQASARAEEDAGDVAPEVERAAQPPAEALEEERHADVLAALQRVREREEAARGHAIARVGVGAAQVESHHAAHDAREHHERGCPP